MSDYLVESVEPGGPWYLVSHSNYARTYVCHSTLNTCTCPSFRYRPGECKHLRRMHEYIAAQDSEDEADQCLCEPEDVTEARWLEELHREAVIRWLWWRRGAL